MIWEGQATLVRADVKVPDTFRHVRKSPIAYAISEDMKILERPLHLPIVRRKKDGGLELLSGQKRLAANDERGNETFLAEVVSCTNEEAEFIRDAENTHRLHNESKQDRDRWVKSSLDLVARRRAMLEKKTGKPVPKAEAVRSVAKSKGVKPASVAQQNRRERRKKEREEKEALKAREVTGDEIATTFDMPEVAMGYPDEGARLSPELRAAASQLPEPFTFDFLDTEEREDIRDYVSKVAQLLKTVAFYAGEAEAALRDCYALSGEDQNPDPQLQALDGYQTVLLQLKETALATIPRSICPDCKGSDSACETCLGAIWVP